MTDDRKGFINGGRREELERLARTRILTSDELVELALADRLGELQSGPDS